MAAFKEGVRLWSGGIIAYEPNEGHSHWKTIKKAMDEISSRSMCMVLITGMLLF